LKEIIEYILAFIIITSIIPVYNIMVNTYYRPTLRYPQANVVEVYANAVTQALNTAFSRGNLTPEIPELYQGILSNIAAVVGQTVFNMYGFNATVYSAITSVNVTANNVTVSTLYNGTLTLLLVYGNGSWSTMSKSQPDSYNPTTNLYTYSFTTPTTPNAVAAVLESPTARFVNYWLKNASSAAYLFTQAGNLRLVVNSGLLSTLKPFNHPNFSTVYNTTLLYYAGKNFGNYNSTYYESLIWVVFNPRGSDVVTLNQSSVGYYSKVSGNFNSTSLVLRVFEGESYVTVNKTCSWTGSTYACGSPVYVGSWVNTRDISLQISNLVMVLLYDGANSIPALVYRGGISIGQPPPTSGYSESVFYIRLGIFDYIVDLKVWQR
jgi:hypothetical protein